MANEKFFTKTELKEEIKKSYHNYKTAAKVYGEMRESRYAAAHKLRNRNSQAGKIGLAIYYHSHQKNNHFSKTELAQAWLDIITVTHEMYEEIGEAAARQAQ